MERGEKERDVLLTSQLIYHWTIITVSLPPSSIFVSQSCSVPLFNQLIQGGDPFLLSNSIIDSTTGIDPKVRAIESIANKYRIATKKK